MGSAEEYGNDTGAVRPLRTKVLATKDRAEGWWGRLVERLRSLVTDRRAQVASAAVLLALVGAFAYAWISASRVVNSYLVDGRVDTRSGVYAAPLVVRRRCSYCCHSR